MEKLKNMSKEEFEKLNNNATFFWKNGFNVTINCKYIQTWEQLAETLGNAFQLPMRNESFDGTWDWLTDLDWLGRQNKIRIYFYESDELLKSNLTLKRQVLGWLEDLIQFWAEDVKNVFIAGKSGEPKQFEIYMVN